MQHQAHVLPYDPNRLFDDLLNWLGVTNDKTLSKKLRIALPLIRNIRAGLMPLPLSILHQMAEHTERSIDELRQVLGDRRRKARLAFALRTPLPA